ncbi:MAG: relaxase/mobilization nuclease domain-containing protein [Tannerella sp.]|nr:relaxase/mobilization nuclease domain-containing protein [Tannerella sp.]
MKDPEDGIYTMQVCLDSFESRLMANQKTEKPVLHVSINPDPKDVLSDEQLSEIAQEWMQKMGYGDQPFIVYKHEDIDRRHIHIVSLRVDSEGKKINDKFEHRRSMDICRELEQKYGLVPADQKKRQEGLPLKPVRYEGGDVKHQIANVIRPISQSWHFQSLKEYCALLTLYNTGVEEVRGEVKGKEYKGLVYSALNDRGEKVGNPFKSSLFGKSVGMEALEKRIGKSAEIIKNNRLKERGKQVIASAMRTCNNRPDFEKALEKQGISVLFRSNAEGRIYGVTFIDHEQKCVFNGSRLGKEFSANVFNDLFNGNGRKPEELDNHKAGQSFEPLTPSGREQEEGSGIGGLFDLFTPETAGDEIAERNFIRRLKKKRQRRM